MSAFKDYFDKQLSFYKTKKTTDELITFFNSNWVMISAKFLAAGQKYVFIKNSLGEVDYEICDYSTENDKIYLSMFTEKINGNLEKNPPKIICCAIYDSRDKSHKFYTESNISTLNKILSSGPKVIYYNGDNFAKVLLSKLPDFGDWESIDIFDIIKSKTGDFIKFSDLINNNFGEKRADVMVMLDKFHSGEIDFDDIKEFLKKDLHYLRELYIKYLEKQLKVPKVTITYGSKSKK